MPAAKKDDKKVMDVAKPSETKADATSKPVIVGHKAQVADPMVAEATDEGATKISVKTGGEKRIEPIAKKLEDTTAEKQSTPESAEATAEEENTVLGSEDTQSDTTATSKEEPVTSEPSGAPVDSVLNGANSVKQAEVAAVQRQEEIEKLVSSGEYKIPVGQPRKHHRKGSLVKGFLAVLLTLVVLAAAAYLLIDAKIIKADIKLPYEFFKDSQPAEDTGGPVKKVQTPKPAAPAKTTITTKSAPIFSITLEEGWKNVVATSGTLAANDLFAAQFGPVKDLGLSIASDESKPTVPVQNRSDAYVVLHVWKVEPSTDPAKPTILDLPQDSSYFTQPLQNCTELGTVKINGVQRIMTMHNSIDEPVTEIEAIRAANKPIVQHIDFFKSGCKTKSGQLASFPIDEQLSDFKGAKVYIRVDMFAKAYGTDETGLVQSVDGVKLKALPEIVRLKAMLESIKVQ